MTEQDGLRSATTRSQEGQLLRDTARRLAEAAEVLAAAPRTEAVDLAVSRLQAAGEALALLSLERAAPQPTAAPEVARAPVLVRRVQLARDPQSAQQARAFCRETCSVWSVPDGVAEVAADVLNELVANAVDHGEDVVVAAVELRSDALLVSAWDDGPGRPQRLAGRSGRGIGLRLVEQLSERWGWTDEREGKWVWARLPLPDETGSPGHDRRTAPSRRAAHRSAGPDAPA